MDLVELIRVVKKEFGDEASVVIDITDIVRWANDGQIEIIRRTDALESPISINTVVGSPTYNIAGGILKINRATYDGYGLQRVSLKQLNKWYPDRGVTGQPNSTPKVFAVVGNIGSSGLQIEVWPRPDSVKQIILYVVAKPTPLVSGGYQTIEIPEEMHDDLVQYCLRRAHEQNGDWEAASVKNSRFNTQTADSMAFYAWNDGENYPVVQDVDGY